MCGLTILFSFVLSQFNVNYHQRNYADGKFQCPEVFAETSIIAQTILLFFSMSSVQGVLCNRYGNSYFLAVAVKLEICFVLQELRHVYPILSKPTEQIYNLKFGSF